MTRVTEAERAIVRAFIEQLYERWAELNPGKVSYAEFARQAGISYSSLATWRAGPPAKKRATPEAPDLIKILRASGVIDQDYRIAAIPQVAAGRAAGPLAQAEEAEKLARRASRKGTPRPKTGHG